MEAIPQIEKGFNNSIVINERKSIVITGVKKIESFDNDEFLLDTALGFMIVRGEELEMIKLDTYQGNVSIKGKIDSLNYLDSKLKKEKENSLFAKLFK